VVSTETAPEAITRDELADALAALKITPEDENTFYPAVADGIFEHVRRSREPEYEPGEIYEDAAGHRYMRVGVAALPWLLVGKDGLVISRVEGVPARPLRRLVPLPGRADLIAALEEDLSREHGYDGQANRVLALLEGAHEGHYDDEDDDDD